MTRPLRILILLALIPLLPLSAQAAEPAPALWWRLRHILVSHRDARLPASQRSLALARRRAEELRQRLLEGADAGELARRCSDGPDAELDGLPQPALRLSNLAPALAEAARGLEVGAVSAVIEDEDGLHLLKREPLRVFAVRQLLVRYAGADRAPASEARTREEARALAEELRRGLSVTRTPEEYWARKLALTQSPFEDSGGRCGLIPEPLLEPALAEALAEAPIGGLCEVVETRFGFHILQREAAELVEVEHILLSDEAEAEALRAELAAAPERFAELQARSEDARPRLDALPRSGPQALAGVAEVAWELAPGEVAKKLAQSRLGWHVLRRRP